MTQKSGSVVTQMFVGVKLLVQFLAPKQAQQTKGTKIMRVKESKYEKDTSKIHNGIYR